jgi:hypothetical protein
VWAANFCTPTSRATRSLIRIIASSMSLISSPSLLNPSSASSANNCATNVFTRSSCDLFLAILGSFA